MNEYKYFFKGWTGKKYYIEMDMAEIQEREKLRLILAVIFVPPVMGFIFALAAGVL